MGFPLMLWGGTGLSVKGMCVKSHATTANTVILTDTQADVVFGFIGESGKTTGEGVKLDSLVGQNILAIGSEAMAVKDLVAPDPDEEGMLRVAVSGDFPIGEAIGASGISGEGFWIHYSGFAHESVT